MKYHLHGAIQDGGHVCEQHNVSNVSNSIMLWCTIMLIQLRSSCVCSFSFNLSVKVIVQCVLVVVIIYKHLTIYIHRVRRKGVAVGGILLSPSLQSLSE